MKRYIGLAAIVAALSCVVVGLATDVGASNGCRPGQSKRAHRTSGNGLPADCMLPVCHSNGQTMSSDTVAQLMPPPAAPTETIWNGQVQEDFAPFTTTACPSYIANGNWH